MAEQPAARPIDLLLVEDNPGDARLAVEALREGRVQNNMHIVEDGVEAMAFLNQEGDYRDVPRPDLILLDLNLPRKDGRTVLQEIKESQSLRSIPVVILTTSQAEMDIMKTYSLHANCYVTKPVDLDQFLDVIKSIEMFWLNIVTLPKDES